MDKLIKITMVGLLLMGYLIIFVVTYGIVEKVLPETIFAVFIWTHVVYFIYKWINDFFEEGLK